MGDLSEHLNPGTLRRWLLLHHDEVGEPFEPLVTLASADDCWLTPYWPHGDKEWTIQRLVVEVVKHYAYPPHEVTLPYEEVRYVVCAWLDDEVLPALADS